MAKDKKERSKLMGAFMWAAKATASVAFGFAVLGALDFTLFHNLAEGEFFMKSIEDEATAVLRGDIPILGLSIADMFYHAGVYFGGPGTGEVVANVADKAAAVYAPIESTAAATSTAVEAGAVSNSGFFPTR